MTPDLKKAVLSICIIYGVLAIYVLFLLYSAPVQHGMLEFVSFFSSFGTADLIWVFLLVYLFMAIGNSTSIPVGIPAVYIFAKAIPAGDFFWLLLILFALAAGFGAASGELGVYALGRGAARFLRNRKGVLNLQFFVHLITVRRSLAPFLVFLFGLTPIPDQLILIPLGVARYPIKKVILPCALGKGLFSLIIAMGATMLNLFGPSTVSITSLIQEGFFLAIVLTVLVACISIDWESVVEKHARKLDIHESSPQVVNETGDEPSNTQAGGE
jgi:membrane protein YqaA with SNARE-associated domain